MLLSNQKQEPLDSSKSFSNTHPPNSQINNSLIIATIWYIRLLYISLYQIRIGFGRTLPPPISSLFSPISHVKLLITLRSTKRNIVYSDNQKNQLER
jgi:hypothetical protein